MNGICRSMLLSLIGMTTTTQAATLRYPSASTPCNTTLQSCIDGAGSLDIIELASNTPIAEFVLIEKSLTLRPASGFTPVLQGVTIQNALANLSVSVTGLRLSSYVRGVLNGNTNLTLDISNNTITNSSANNAIDLHTGSTNGILTASIRDNVIRQTGGAAFCADAIHVINFSGEFRTTITGNRLILQDLGACTGINVAVATGARSTTVIDRNAVRAATAGSTTTSFNAGILVGSQNSNRSNHAIGKGANDLLTAQISNNLVVGQHTVSRVAAGLVGVSAANNSSSEINFINNTVVQGDDGIIILAGNDDGTTISGGAFNNIVAFHSNFGLMLALPPPLNAFPNSHNLVFSNTTNVFNPGPGTRTGDPAFEDMANGAFNFGVSSDAYDRGLNSALPAAFSLDLSGNARIHGPSIDIGAIESIEQLAGSEPQAVPALGAGTLRLLIAVLMVAGLLALVNRQRVQ